MPPRCSLVSARREASGARAGATESMARTSCTRFRAHAFPVPGGYGVAAEDAAEAWRAIVPRAAVGVHPYMTPLTALRDAGAEADLLAPHFDEVRRAERDEIMQAWPRGPCFGALSLEAHAAGTAHRPGAAFGNVCADVPERCAPDYRRTNFRGPVPGSTWPK